MYSSAFCTVYNQFGWNYFPEAFGQHLLTWLDRRGICVKRSLDLACGTGVLCEILHDHGIQAQGADLSEGMIAVARQRRQDIPYTVADMVLYRPEPGFDLVTCTGDAINHIMSLQDVERIFSNVHYALNPGGYFIFDILNENEVPASDPFDLDFSEDVKAQFCVTRDEAGLVHLCTTVEERGKEPFTEEIIEIVHDPETICALLKKVGFTVLQCADHLLPDTDCHGTSWYIVAQK